MFEAMKTKKEKKYYPKCSSYNKSFVRRKQECVFLLFKIFADIFQMESRKASLRTDELEAFDEVFISAVLVWYVYSLFFV